MFKIRWNKANTTAAIYACGVLALTLTGISLVINISFLYRTILSFFSSISPLIYGLMLAYIINPLLKFSEKIISKIKRRNFSPMIRRLISLIITYLLVSLLLFLIGLLIFPQIVGNYENIINNTSEFLLNTVEKIGKILGMESEERISSLQTRINGYARSFLSYIGEASGRFALWFLQFLLGCFLSIFILLHKERLICTVKKLLAALLRPKTFNSIISITHLTDRTFGRFFIGKIFDSLIIGVISFIIFWIFRMPYYPLLSAIVCVTNIIPYFGPIFGAVPCVILVMTESPYMALWLALMILIIQQVDGNIIGPKILGNATGLSSLWVVVAITVMGSFFGFVGMVIGVPLFSVIYTIIKERTERRLKKKNLPTETAAYNDINPVDLLEESARKQPVYETDFIYTNSKVPTYGTPADSDEASSDLPSDSAEVVDDDEDAFSEQESVPFSADNTESTSETTADPESPPDESFPGVEEYTTEPADVTSADESDSTEPTEGEEDSNEI